MVGGPHLIGKSPFTKGSFVFYSWDMEMGFTYVKLAYITCVKFTSETQFHLLRVWKHHFYMIKWGKVERTYIKSSCISRSMNV